MKLHNFLLPVVIVLAVLFVSYPVIPADLKDKPVVTKPLPSEIINLGNFTPPLGSPCGTGQGFFLVPPDGSFPSTPTLFVIPAGKVLIITAFQWQASGFPANSSNARATLFRATGTGGNNALISPAMSDSSGRAGSTVVIPNGIVVESGIDLCMTTGTSAAAFLQCYLADV